MSQKAPASSSNHFRMEMSFEIFKILLLPSTIDFFQYNQWQKYTKYLIYSEKYKIYSKYYFLLLFVLLEVFLQ